MVTKFRPIQIQALDNREKRMFTLPVGDWLVEKLSHFARGLLFVNHARELEWFNLGQISLLLNQHVHGAANDNWVLRAFITIELWFKTFQDDDLMPSPLGPDKFLFARAA